MSSPTPLISKRMRTAYGFVNALSDEVQAQISRLCEEGDAMYQAGRLYGAMSKYAGAMIILSEQPGHIFDYEAATYLYSCRNDVYFNQGKFDLCRRSALTTLKCPGADQSPAVHLRLGQAEFEMGHMEEAAKSLTRAFELGGREIFDGEDPKYLAQLGKI